MLPDVCGFYSVECTLQSNTTELCSMWSNCGTPNTSWTYCPEGKIKEKVRKSKHRYIPWLTFSHFWHNRTCTKWRNKYTYTDLLCGPGAIRCSQTKPTIKRTYAVHEHLKMSYWLGRWFIAHGQRWK